MGDYYQTCPIPKPTPRKRVKGRKQRAERAVKQSVRAACVERDGGCRAATWTCSGPLEWAHLVRRSLTRGESPERRHNTATSLMLCRFHHQQEEAGRLKVFALTDEGCDGPLRFEVKA
jgi:hypothetical protein